MSDIIRQLHTDHINISKLLDLLEREIEMFHNEETPDYALMLDAMRYMVNYPDLVHHPTEDLIFEKLKNRDPDTGAEVDRLTAEHQALADKSAQFLESLRRIENETTMVSREAVEAQGVGYISLLRTHMSKEEGQVFPRAHQALVDDDWLEIGAALKKQEDPVFGEIVAEEHRTLYDWLASQAE
ncbi:MAG: hemerythrin domain-containing protein [Gammaproteobacteria bacterium]|jgi:hemerythrin-like domain-containing protein|nr:hemerythrin domain-containing protein [Gammaproteobacteria bacterium]